MIDKDTYDEKSLFPKIIAVDFDGTLVENKFPDIGVIIRDTWDRVLEEQKAGTKIILWTCRTDTMLDDAVNFCTKNGLTFDEINRNIKEVRDLFGGDTRKVFANIYLDDRAQQYL